MGLSSIFAHYRSKSLLTALFIFCALPVTGLTALLTPPGQTPDEAAHMIRAAGLLHGAIIAQKITMPDPNTGKPQQETGVKADTGLVITSFGITTMTRNHRPVETEGDFHDMMAEPVNHKLSFFSIANTATYFPVPYLPATLGLFAANLFNARPFIALITARLFMATAFMIIGALALYLAAFGEALLFCVLIMPMTLFLAGTLNEDGILIPLTCLACALISRGTRTARWAGLVVFATVLGSKQPYVPLMGVFLEPLFTTGWVKRLRQVVIATLPVVLWAIIVVLFVAVPFGKPPYHPGPLFAGPATLMLDHTNVADNLHILLARPSRFLTLPWRTNMMFGVDLFHQMIGALGLLQINLAKPVYWLWEGALLCALLGLAAQSRPTGVPGTRWRDAACTLALILLTYWLINIVFYLDWTNVGVAHIDGLQGRYLLPFLPFLLFGLPYLPRLRRIPMIMGALPAIGLGVFQILYVPKLLASYFYLH